MKILWLSGNTSLYSNRTKDYNSGGWIGALERKISNHCDVELAVSFIFNDDCFKKKIGKTIYYPLDLYNSKIKKLRHNLFYEKSDEIEMQALLKVIKDFEPDLIHVWGTEISFGLISKYTSIPVVIHLQGLLNPVFNALFIPGVSENYFLNETGSRFFKKFFNFQTLRFWKHNSNREVDILENCKSLIGRTNWDKQISLLLAPKAKYHYCSELLRPSFFEANKWQSHQRNKVTMVSVLSNPAYKGIDLILKCANVLKNFTKIEFEWNIYGVNNCHFAEKLTGIKSKNVNVNLKGVANAEELISSLLISDIFVHPSYIDNSPNSVCEAQILGMPIIATNVGGVSSLIENDVTGILISANDPWILAAKIVEMKDNPELGNKLGRNGREAATQRHNSIKIVSNLVSIYQEIIK
jgi:glycosyltransferase involved in cell wall biosynthesis